ncbi:cytosolic phospholipase A2 gamma isoform X2 [Amia ocellicauda]|uniref:cytosolic phospholipase A2 gamma isoform X2 n=1 Tax=Amia ocellicauda TaxID=2972642 RepID=UPI003463BBEB
MWHFPLPCLCHLCCHVKSLVVGDSVESGECLGGSTYIEETITYLSSRSKPVRVSHSLCEEEKEAVEQRKVKIHKCLQELGIPCDSADVPQIAVLGSGGGLRAMLALMGTLSELGAQNLLDSILYLCGVSGSTWCMSSLYKEKDWSSRVEEREKEMVETLTTGYVTLMSKWDRVLKAVKDENYSLTDIWTGRIVYDIVKKEDKQHLSSYTDETMVNPYPIFAVVDKWRLDHKEEHDKGVWFEITRHEAGYPGYGAFVDTSVFGSRFKAGEITERKEEMDMLYLQDWISNSFNAEKKEESVNRNRITCKGDHCGCDQCTEVQLNKLKEAFLSGKDCKPILITFEETQEGENKALLSNMKDSWDQKNEEEQADLFLILEMTIRVTINSPKLLKILSNWIWGTKFNFLHEFSSREDDLPSVLVQDEKIYLVDAGLANNCGYPLVLRPDRQVQLILSFDFSAGDPFLTVHQAAEYCKKNNIPFPDIPVVSEEEKDNPSDCYIYSGENTPTVMHFPLFNKANCGDKDNIKEMNNTFSTAATSYNQREIQLLLKVSKMNVVNNRDQIIAKIKKSVETKQKKKYK